MKRNPIPASAPLKGVLMRMSRAASAALLILAALTPVGRVEADETLLCHRYIVAVPFTITVPGALLPWSELKDVYDCRDRHRDQRRLRVAGPEQLHFGW